MQFNPSPNKQLVRQFITNGHYSGSCPGAKYAFSLEIDGKIIGGCVFSKPSRQNISVTGAQKILELARLYIVDDTPKNTESFFIGSCLRWLKKNTDFEAVVSFADPTEGHKGTIYKATNFELVGTTNKNYHYLNQEGKRVHKRQVWDRAKKYNRHENQQAIIENLTKIDELPKFKFVYYLRKIKNPNIIYGLVDPFTHELRYIGKSTSGLNRPKEHFKPFNLKPSTHKTHWIKSVLLKNRKPEIIILEILNDPNHLEEAEQFWIEYYKAIGSRLTNSTDGGIGSLGRKLSDVTKEKLSCKINN